MSVLPKLLAMEGIARPVVRENQRFVITSIRCRARDGAGSVFRRAHLVPRCVPRRHGQQSRESLQYPLNEHPLLSRLSIKFPPTTHLSRLLMTSKLRLLGDGTAGVYVKCFFSRHSGTSSALLGPLKFYREGQTTHFEPHYIHLGRALIGSLPQFNYLQKSNWFPIHCRCSLRYHRCNNPE